MKRYILVLALFAGLGLRPMLRCGGRKGDGN